MSKNIPNGLDRSRKNDEHFERCRLRRHKEILADLEHALASVSRSTGTRKAAAKSYLNLLIKELKCNLKTLAKRRFVQGLDGDLLESLVEYQTEVLLALLEHYYLPCFAPKDDNDTSRT